MSVCLHLIGATSIWSGPEIKGVLAAAGCLASAVILVYAVMAIRDRYLESHQALHPSDHLGEFEEMVDSGNLSRFELMRVRGAIVAQSKEASNLEPTEATEESLPAAPRVPDPKDSPA